MENNLEDNQALETMVPRISLYRKILGGRRKNVKDSKRKSYRMAGKECS